MGEKMRATTHRGRGHKGHGRKGCPFDPDHNGREFELEKAKNIDPELTKENIYWTCKTEIQYGGSVDFDEVERQVYEELFTEGLEARNERYTKEGHKDRCQTIEEYRQAIRSCPEEEILQIGAKEDRGKVSKDALWAIASEYKDWFTENYPNVKMLDMALHFDEPHGQIHVQERMVWVAKDKSGFDMVSQSKALKEMGIERPDPTKPKDRYNNPKQTFTRECREKFVSICKAHGFDIEEQPKEKSKTGLSLDMYKSQQEQEKLEKLKQEEKQLSSQLAELQSKTEEKKTELKELGSKVEESKTELAVLKNQVEESKVELAETEKVLQGKKSILELIKNPINDFLDFVWNSHIFSDTALKHLDRLFNRYVSRADRYVKEWTAPKPKQPMLSRDEIEKTEKSNSDKDER